MRTLKFKASVRGEIIECQQLSERSVEVDGRRHDFDFRQVTDNEFSLILSGKSYQVHHVADPIDLKEGTANTALARKVGVAINGVEYAVVLDDERSLLLREFFTKSDPGNRDLLIRAPMPGLISKIEAEVGAAVTKGQGLLVLEAMKMENEIRAFENGRVKEIHVQKGKTVEKDEPLVTIEKL
jgi:biotin carboxyl carrier protein